MLPRMILHTLLAALVIGALAFAYQASSQGNEMADAAGGLSRSVGDDGDEIEDD